MQGLIQEAYEALNDALFGPDSDWRETGVTERAVKRDAYERELKLVQERFGLKEGHPLFLEWVLTCVGRSPTLLDKEED